MATYAILSSFLFFVLFVCFSVVVVVVVFRVCQACIFSYRPNSRCFWFARLRLTVVWQSTVDCSGCGDS